MYDHIAENKMLRSKSNMKCNLEPKTKPHTQITFTCTQSNTSNGNTHKTNYH